MKKLYTITLFSLVFFYDYTYARNNLSIQQNSQINPIINKALSYNDWESCVYSYFTDSFKEFATIGGTGFLYYMKKKGYKEAAKYVIKTVIGAANSWLTPVYVIGMLSYIGGNCAYLEWE